MVDSMAGHSGAAAQLKVLSDIGVEYASEAARFEAAIDRAILVLTNLADTSYSVASHVEADFLRTGIAEVVGELRGVRPEDAAQRSVGEGQPYHMEPVPDGELDDWGRAMIATGREVQGGE
jgi:hypothetical protein